MLLAIETSCDETAVAVIDLDVARQDSAALDKIVRSDIISSQIKLHQPYGGVVPELAAREHVVNLPKIAAAAINEAGISVEDISAVAVTRGPGLKGCLLVGLCFAKAFCYAKRIALVPVHHIEAHLTAGWLMPECSRPEYPVLGLVVSGGHTMLVYLPEFRKYQVIASTRDDAAGEAFDKGATLLRLPYPGGPALSKAAEGGDRERFPFPIGVPEDLSSFSFSGLKTAACRTVKVLGEKLDNEVMFRDLAASLEWAIVRALVAKSLAAAQVLKPKSFLLTGGVAANRVLRETLAQELARIGLHFSVPDRLWCTDNAAMVGLLGAKIISQTPETYRDWLKSGDSSRMLGPGVPKDIGALPRWPIDRLFSEQLR
jgi:N6-L-threonylcarbamoyladenine synthase